MNRSDPFLTVDELDALGSLVHFARTWARRTHDLSLGEQAETCQGIIDRHRAAVLQEQR